MEENVEQAIKLSLGKLCFLVFILGQIESWTYVSKKSIETIQKEVILIIKWNETWRIKKNWHGLSKTDD